MADRFTEMEVFLRVAEAGSFAAAASRLGLSPQMIGRYVGGLEQRLGTRLLHRSTRRQSLTDAGRLYLDGCRRTLAEADAAEARVTAQAGAPRGLLRITAPLAFGAACLAPELASFLAAQPEVIVQLDLSDRRANLVEEGYDAAIRIGALPDSALLTRALAPYRLAPCAALGYVARRGLPLHPAELAEHDCLDYVFAAHPAPAIWQFRAGGRIFAASPAGRLRVNDSRALLEAALAGCGVALLAERVLDPHLAAGRLVRVLPGYEVPPRPMALLFPRQHADTPKLRAFLDWAAARFGAATRAR